jgi:two-component system OmpR family response regulator
MRLIGWLRLFCRWNGVVVDMTLTEFCIIDALAKWVGRVKNREQPTGESQMVVDESTITSQFKRIRRKFQSLDQEFDCIETGYRWNSHQ